MAIDSKGCGWLLFKAYWGVIILSTPLAFAGPTKAQLPSQRVSHGETARSCLGEEELLTDSLPRFSSLPLERNVVCAIVFLARSATQELESYVIALHSE